MSRSNNIHISVAIFQANPG